MTHKKRILLVEDEAEIAALLRLQAEMEGYKMQVEADGLNGYRAIEREKPDLVILDTMLPGQNGFDICRKLKNSPELRHIPVIIISAKSEELDVILGLELGADDYVAKPFSPKVLFSRIKAVLRRSKEPDKMTKIFTFGEFTLEVDRYILRKGDTPIQLTLSEFGIVKKLLEHRGQVLTRNQLLEDIQSDDAFIVDRNIDVHVASLRKKLGPHFDWIETVRGVGYRFKEEPAAVLARR
jgi:two-component system, OmpR family, alkaline phosphatase synthesis response regulator PhoP